MVIGLLLTPLTWEEVPYFQIQAKAISDVSPAGLWINGQTAFCDVRVFNPLGRCHLHYSISDVNKKNENKKKREFNQVTLQVEYGSFKSLAFSCFGKMSREYSCFFLHAAERLANRRIET